ncbi:MAG: hypothetical protein WA001_01815, partial [Patescibacteria group bacterium]
METTNAQTPPAKNSQNGTIKYVGIAVVVLILAGCGYAYAQGWFGSGKIGAAPPTLQDMAAQLSNMQTAQVQTSVDLRVEPKDADVTALPFTPPWATSTSPLAPNLFKTFPSDLVITGSITSNWQRKTANSDLDTHITGTYHAGGITADADVAIKKIADSYYIQLNTLPIPGLDLTSLKGTWITWSADDAKKLLPMVAFPTSPTSTATSATDETKESMVLWQQLMAQNAIRITQSERTDLNGRAAWHITLALDAVAFQKAFVTGYDNKASMLQGVSDPKIFTASNDAWVTQDANIAWLQDLFKDTQLEA